MLLIFVSIIDKNLYLNYFNVQTRIVTEILLDIFFFFKNMFERSWKRFFVFLAEVFILILQCRTCADTMCSNLSKQYQISITYTQYNLGVLYYRC